MWVLSQALDRTTRYPATHPSRLTAPLGAIESCGRVQAFFVATFFFDRKSILDLLQLSSLLPFFWFSKMVLKEKHKDGAGRPVIFEYYLLRTSSLNGGVCWILSWKRSRWLFVGTRRYPTRRTSVLSKHPSHMMPESILIIPFGMVAKMASNSTSVSNSQTSHSLPQPWWLLMIISW